MVFLDNSGFFRMNQSVYYKLRNGLTIRARAGTTDIGVITRTFFGKENNEFLGELNKRPVIIDIGAHIGTVSMLFALKFPHAKIYSYEPHPHNYRLLKENIAINNMMNVKAFKNAVSDKKQKVTLYFREKYTAGCSLDPLLQGCTDNVNRADVETMRLDDVFKDNKIKVCDLLKIDAEGVDYLILSGASEKTLRNIKHIHAEFHNKVEKDEMEKLLKKYDFIVKTVWHTKDYGNVYAHKR